MPRSTQFTKRVRKRHFLGFTDAKVVASALPQCTRTHCHHRTTTNTRLNKDAFGGGWLYRTIRDAHVEAK